MPFDFIRLSEELVDNRVPKNVKQIAIVIFFAGVSFSSSSIGSEISLGNNRMAFAGLLRVIEGGFLRQLIVKIELCSISSL